MVTSIWKCVPYKGLRGVGKWVECLVLPGQGGLPLTFIDSSFSMNRNQRSANSSVKGQVADILGFIGHMASVTTTQPCHCSMKARTIHKWLWLCSNKTLFTKTGGGQDLVLMLPWLTPDLNHLELVKTQISGLLQPPAPLILQGIH